MKNLIEYFVKQGTLVNVMTALLLVAGLYSMIRIQREVFPNISFDVITVTTVYPGGSAESTERLITNPLEQSLREVDGIKKMTSVSVEGTSVITLQLDPDQTTEAKAEADIQDVVDAIRDLPDAAEDPVVTVLESKRRPIITVAITGDDEERLRVAAKRLEREIEVIPEVAKVNFDGLRDYEIRVEAIPEKLRRYRVSMSQVVQALQLQNANIAGGVLEAGLERDGEMIIRTIGEFTNADDVGNTIIRANALGEAVRVRDVATVSLGFEKAKLIFKTNGRLAMNLTVLKKENADAIRLVDKVREKVKEVTPNLGEGIESTFVNDSSYFVRRRLSVLSNNLFVGLTLVLVVLSLVMPWNIAVVTALGIPFAFLGAIAIFHFGDVSLNLISMMGLIIVAGMLVDDAVVVTENAQAQIDLGKTPSEAAVLGTQQIWAPVTASVFTTMMAFAPMVFMSGIFGKFIRFIPIGVIIALSVSLFECFFILPHHIAAWIRARPKDKQKSGYFGNAWTEVVIPKYGVLIQKAIKRKYWVAGFSVLLVVGSVYFAAKKMDFILFPPGAIDTFNIKVEAPVGTPLQATEKLVLPLENYVKTMPSGEVQNFVTKIGQLGSGVSRGRKQGAEYAQITVYLTAVTERERTALDIIDDLKKNVGTPPGLTRVTYERRRGGPPVGAPVSIGIRGDTYDEIMLAAGEIKKELAQIEGVFDVEDNFIAGKPELKLTAIASEASAAGLSLRDIGTSVRAAFEGIVATNIRTLDEEIAVRVLAAPKFRQSSHTLDNLEIANARGNLIPLKSVVQFSEGASIANYEHENNRRQVRVSAEIDTSLNNSRAVNGVMTGRISTIAKKFPSLSFDFGGEASDTRESLQTLRDAFGFAFFGIILLLIILFKNIYQPFLVACTIPMGVVAVIWAFFLHGAPLTFLAIVGVIALSGVIVNNAIVYVDFVNKARDQGESDGDSIINAATRRLRPIFLTTMTTAVGILPTAYGIGGLDPFVVPIALALGWGMLAGAILTSILIPCVISISDDGLAGLQKFRQKALLLWSSR